MRLRAAYIGQFLSKKRTAEALAELFGTPLSPGTVAATAARAAGRLDGFPGAGPRGHPLSCLPGKIHRFQALLATCAPNWSSVDHLLAKSAQSVPHRAWVGRQKTRCDEAPFGAGCDREY